MKSAILFSLAFAAAAQDSRFEARSRLVLVPVTITDAKGRGVDGLESPDFLVLDNGRTQKISVDTIATGVAPLALAIAVQSSGISRPVLDKVEKIGGMIRPLVTGDRGCVALLSFAENVRWLQECTNSSNALERSLRQLRPGEAKQAHMLDAVSAAVEHLRRYPTHRRVLLLISESKDRGSETDLASATVAAQMAGVTVYAATYSAFRTGFTSKAPNDEPGLRDAVAPVPNPNRTVDGEFSNPRNPKLITRQNSVDLSAVIVELARLHKTEATQVLTGGTGGTTLPFARQKGLEEAIEKLGAELNTQYLISFAPDLTTPGYHHLEIRVPRNGGYHIRAQPGYWSAE